MGSISGLLNGKTKHTFLDKCGVCGEKKQCWYSTDIHNTYAICEKCAKTEEMEHCKYCGDMRYPENIDRPDPARFSGRGGFCPGCFDEAIYIIMRKGRTTKRKTKPKKEKKQIKKKRGK